MATTSPPAVKSGQPATDWIAAFASSALDSGTEAEALTTVADAARREPDYAPHWQWLGLLYRALDQHRDAIMAFERAAVLAPSDARILHGLARTRFEAGLPAVADYDRALKAAPLDGEMQLSRVAALRVEVGAKAALAILEDLLDDHPGWLPGHGLAAQLRWAGGDRVNFAATVERAIGCHPNDPALWRILLGLHTHAGDHHVLLEVCSRARNAIGDAVIVRGAEAIAFSELGMVAAADAAFARLPTRHDITLAVRHVRHLLRTRRTKAAAMLAERFTGTPQARLIWPYLSLAWRSIGDSRCRWLENEPFLLDVTDMYTDGTRIDALAGSLRSLHDHSQLPLDQSLRGGMQTDGNLFHRTEPEIQDVRAAILGKVSTFVGGFPPLDPHHPVLAARRDRPFRFSGAWSVRLHETGFHVSHNHPEGWLSGVYYAALPSSEGVGGTLELGAPPPELELNLPPLAVVKPRAGRLVLFSSTTWHRTLPFVGDERLTIAFDVAYPRG